MTEPHVETVELLRKALQFYADQWDQDVDAERTAAGWEGSIGAVEPTEALLNDFGQIARAALSTPTPIVDDGVVALQDESLIKDLRSPYIRREWIEQAADRLAALSAWAVGPNGVKWHTARTVAMAAENAKLREALEPFARIAHAIDTAPYVAWDEGRILSVIKATRLGLRMFFNARAALSKEPSNGV